MIYRDQLEAVKRVIQKRENWCQGSFALNKRGEPCDSNDESATCWCLVGAFDKAFGDANGFFFVKQFKALLGIPPVTPTLTALNDSSQHHEVLNFLQAAINRAPVRP